MAGKSIHQLLCGFGTGLPYLYRNNSTIWPLFGTGNQLLATIALAVTTSFLINVGKQKYAWITLGPMCLVGATTLTAGVLSIKNIFWLTSKSGQVFTGYLDSVLMSILFWE